ncbi:MAG: hypothetical protein IAE79_02595 [Anaerolinea sp.]|nr:hypothetical protein [Anaerolinea sp.]
MAAIIIPNSPSVFNDFQTAVLNGRLPTQTQTQTQARTPAQCGIDFFDANGVLVREWVAGSLAAREARYSALGADDMHPEWPETAVRIVAWERYPRVRETCRRNPLTGHFVGGGRGER